MKRSATIILPIIFILIIGSEIALKSQAGGRTAKGASDLYAAAEQSLVDKVVNEAQYPITLVDNW